MESATILTPLAPFCDWHSLVKNTFDTILRRGFTQLDITDNLCLLYAQQDINSSVCLLKSRHCSIGEVTKILKCLDKQLL